MLNFIVWNADPELLHTSFISIRWYSLMFAIGFLVGFNIVERMFRHDNAPEKWCPLLLLWVVAGTVIGARLGHVFFYEWDYYSAHPAEIIKTWHGGLASHGAAIGIVSGLWLSSRKNKVSVWWTADKLGIIAPLSGAMIRFGNLFNSEIIGNETTVPWGFKFMRLYPNLPAELVPVRHATQLYEALCYIVVFVILFALYRYTKLAKREGFIFGAAMVGIFTPRFLIEFIKINQVAFEQGMTFNMGQWLSVPFILAGIAVMIWAWRRYKGEPKVVVSAAPHAKQTKNKRHYKK